MRLPIKNLPQFHASRIDLNKATFFLLFLPYLHELTPVFKIEILNNLNVLNRAFTVS